jgi:hypothetical protein
MRGMFWAYVEGNKKAHYLVYHGGVLLLTMERKSSFDINSVRLNQDNAVQRDNTLL